MDEYVKFNPSNYQYDGAIITTELAAKFSFNKINFGITYGVYF
jgi:hypothetical protein